jgi:IS1 family transposase
MTLVDRHTSCILAWRVAFERTETLLQAMVDEAPQAAFYYSDLFATYRQLVYTPGRYTPMPDKSQTYRVEGDNAELRHYLARLARKSRCFSRCVNALRRAVKLFVTLWNRRQLHRHRFPKYPAHLTSFLDSPI